MTLVSIRRKILLDRQYVTIIEYLLFDCDSKGQYPRAVRTLILVGTYRPNEPEGELLVPESRPAGDLHLRPRPHTESVLI